MQTITIDELHILTHLALHGAQELTVFGDKYIMQVVNSLVERNLLEIDYDIFKVPFIKLVDVSNNHINKCLTVE